MQIQDAVHGYIQLNDLEEQVLDTPEMQRLRRVKQLGFSNLVYPSATHTRFEHSLGAMHLADKFARSMRVGKGRAQELRLAALLHDVGHGPFSHTADDIFHRYDTSHEHFSKQKIMDSAISDILHDHGIHPKRVTKLIDGEGRLGHIIAGHIDVDRMDYLMRDAHYTGVAYGTIDADTIIRSAQIHEKKLVFDGKYLNSLESLLTARYLMNPTVYLHRTSRIADLMFHEAFRQMNEEDPVTMKELAAMDDVEIVSRLRNSAGADMMRQIEQRRLYKIAVSRPDPADHDMSEDALEQHIQDEIGLAEQHVLADKMLLQDTKTYDVPVLHEGRVESMEELSDLPAALKQSLQKNSAFRVYAPHEHADAVAAAAETVL